MQNKGAIKFFAVALALVCLYQLSFTFVTSRIKDKAAAYAKGDKKKELAYLDSMSSKEVYNLLVKNYTLREAQDREMNLGLDLKGGMNVQLEISVVDLIKVIANNSTDKTLNKALQKALEMEKSSQEDFVTLFGKAYKALDPNARLAAVFANLNTRNSLSIESSNEEVLKFLKKETDAAIDNSFNILRSRIDKFGVVQPNIQKLSQSGRILVELPGIKDPERVRKLLQGSANLEFWETYDNSEVFQYLKVANDRYAEILKLKADKKDNSGSDTTANQSADSTKIAGNDKTADTGAANLLTELKKDTSKAKNAVADQQSKLNPLFSLLQPNVNRDNTLGRGAEVGMALRKDTAKINRILSDPRIKSSFPSNLRLLWKFKPIDEKRADGFQLVALKASKDGKCALAGDVITDARADFAQNKASSEVSMTMNSDGAKQWARLTKANIQKQVAIVLDNSVYSDPTVQNEINGGSSQITGQFSINEAKDLANILKSGKMPAPARIIQEEIVGPSLGKESINNSMSSFAIAFLLVLAFMVFFYKSAGWAANVALLVNVFFLFGILASINAVLTLPGIAGMVLTMGMAVDANVLIYERILEETRGGKGYKLAVTEGFKRALPSIIDGNLTTFLTGVILFIFGSGPIQGFATTLCIGILTSLFTSIFISRLIIEWQMGKNKEVSFAGKLTENWLIDPKADFMGMRKYFYAFSGIVLLAGVISLSVRGLNYGVDFTGGHTYVVRFDNTVKTSEVQSLLEKAFKTSPEVKTYGSDNQVKITTKYLVNSTDPNAEQEIETKLFEGLKPLLKADISFEKFSTDYKQSSQKVGPTVANDIKTSAIWAVFFALIAIALYILVRFRNISFSLGGLISLAHDVLFTIGWFSILYSVMPFSMEIDQAFIAAILTIIGFSINDTVVIFDRVRESIALGHAKHWDRKETYNRAMNVTLRRTLNTSLTVLITIVAIFIFGGEVLRGFIFALLIGIGVGTYSSIFVATCTVYEIDLWRDRKAKKAEAIQNNQAI